jgi:hypothetical protein
MIAAKREAPDAAFDRLSIHFVRLSARPVHPRQ